jgi:hypothetical protein
MLQFTEENDIPGLLILIDFEKAFDSISWDQFRIPYLVVILVSNF